MTQLTLEKRAIGPQTGLALKNLFRMYFFGLLLLEMNLLVGSRMLASSLLMVFSYIAILLSFFAARGTDSRPHNFDLVFISSVILLFYFVLSLGWSSDRADTVIQSLLFGAVLFPAFVFSTLPSSFIIRVVLKSAMWVCIISFLIIPLAPEIAFQPRWSTSFPEVRGIFAHQQRFGLFLCLAFGIGTCAHLNKWQGIFGSGILKSYGFFALVMCVGILFSFARLYMVFSVLAFFMTIVFSRSSGLRFFSILILLEICIGILLTSNPVSQFIFSLGTESGENLTGRTIIWARTINYASLQPISGYGYGTFGSNVFDSIWGVYRPPNAHNSFINMYFEGGLIGMGLLVFCILTHFFRSVQSTGHRGIYSITMYVFSQALLASLTGVTYGGKQSLLLGVLLIIMLNRPEDYFRLSRDTKTEGI